MPTGRSNLIGAETQRAPAAFELPASGLVRDTSGVGVPAGDRSHSRVSTELGLSLEYPRKSGLKHAERDPAPQTPP
jgi:hypothetical protein